MKTIWLQLNITSMCNKNCSFCASPKDMPTGVMTPEIIDRVVELYRNHVTKNGFEDYSSLSLLGGEPLLYKNLCKDIIYKTREISSECKWAIFTNGLLLDKEFLDWSLKNKVLIYMSTNDQSNEFIEEKCKEMSGILSGLSIALTFDMLERLDHILDVCFKYHIKPRLRHSYYDCGDPEYIKFYDNVITKSFKRILEKNYIFHPRFFYEMTDPLWDKDWMRHICGRNYFVIDPDGSTRVCLWRNKEEDKLGNILEENFNFEDKIKNHNHPKLGYEKIADCLNCEFKNLCGGGCPFIKMLTYGDINRPSPLCSTFKKVFPMLIEMTRRWKNARFQIV